MRPDEDVDLSLFDFLDDILLLLRSAKAADHLDHDRECCEPTLESLVMLEGQNRCRREHSNLPVILHRLEGGAHSDFSLAVTDVAAEQTVHWHGGFHVLLNVGDGGDLIVSFVVIERVFELALPLRVHGVGMAVRHFALCVELKQLVGHVAHGLLHACFRLCPLGATKAAQRRSGTLSRTIFLNQVEAGQRNVKLRCFSELEKHELADGVALGKFFQTLILRDAVLHVNHIIPGNEIAEIREEGRNFRLLPERLRNH